MRSSRHRILAGLAGLALLGSAAACSSDTSDSGSGAGGTAGKPAAAGPATDTKAASKNKKKPAVDACTLLEKDEVEGIIGPNGGGGPGAGVGESICEWENESNAHSITVSIGTAGTSRDGKVHDDTEGLPGAGTPEAGPDGIVFAADNTASFVVGDRVCYVQVVTDVTSNKDRDKAVRLIRLIRARTGGRL